ncbi:MAG: hypothetical protein HYZ75_01485 [Elusimicrobia bacterium]|nr:hypothetical protein [Elusimicrobiota bacterium]
MPDPAFPAPPLPAACWSCAKPLDPFDRYCRFCGHGQGDNVAWYYQRWGIALSSVLGLGPFAVVMVVRSPLLSGVERWVWSAAILGVNAWLGWRFYKTVMTMNAFITSAMQGF